jgi:hypothetical protein
LEKVFDPGAFFCHWYESVPPSVLVAATVRVSYSIENTVFESGCVVITGATGGCAGS